MVAKVFLVLCGSVLLAQTISAQCIGYGGDAGLNNLALAELAGARIAGAELAGAGFAGSGYGYGLGAPAAYGYGLGAPAGYGYGLGAPAPIAPAAAFAATNGGGFTVISSSPITPTGITVFSDNTIEGPMEVVGQLPILAAVSVDGSFPSNGAASTTYSCGNGQVGISGESLAAAGLGAGYAGNLARAELAGAQLAGAQLAGAQFSSAQLAGAQLAGAQLAGAEIAAARLARPCGAYN